MTKRAALAIHGIVLAEHGGKPGILNEGLLDAAMDAPRNHFALSARDGRIRTKEFWRAALERLGEVPA